MTAAATRSIRHRGAAPAAPSGLAPPVAPGADAAPADAPRLRLAAARGALGLELDAPFGMRPLRLTGLSIVFPNIRFPIDLTGGVTRFRHRRGVLARLELDVAPAELAAWAAPRLRGLLGSGTPDVWLSAVEGGLAVGLADGEAALAFDVLVVPSGAGLTLVPERARGIGLGAPPQALALRALAAALGSHARVDGGGFPLPDAAGALLRAALPPAGRARRPSPGPRGTCRTSRATGSRSRPSRTRRRPPSPTASCAPARPCCSRPRPRRPPTAATSRSRATSTCSPSSARRATPRSPSASRGSTSSRATGRRPPSPRSST